jgi:hypothetical protein
VSAVAPDSPTPAPAPETKDEQVKEVLEVIRRYSASFQEGGIELAALEAADVEEEEKLNPLMEL